MGRGRIPSIDNFWRKVRKTDGCWLWEGRVRSPHGYGGLTYMTQTWSTHRFSWYLSNGPIPAGMQVLHRCDVPLCVRPDHLFLGTQADNMKDRSEKGRAPRGAGNKMTKLTEEDVRFIRRRYAEGGISQPELGRMYGVTHKAIGLIIQRKNWAWVD